MAVTIRGKTLPLPILQGGMGVGISLDGLAGAVAASGGMGFQQYASKRLEYSFAKGT